MEMQTLARDPDIKMGNARAAARLKAPYFSSLIHGFVYVPVPGIRTMGCSAKMVLGYDPAWVARGTVDELAADIMHECHHFFRRHFDRAVGRDPVRWNKAGDLAINPDLINEGWKLSPDSLFPKQFNFPEGLSTEEYYALLEEQEQSSPEPQEGEGEGGGEGDGDKPARGIGRGCCGSIAGSQENSEFEQGLDADPEVGRSPAEVRGLGLRAAADLKQHIETHGRGSVPNSLVELVKSFEEGPQVRWQDELAHVIRNMSGRLQSGGHDFSMSRPSKRSFMRGFPRPGMIENLPEVAIIRDTSGSMGQKQLMDATREAYFIMRAIGIDEVWFVDADTQLAMPWKRVGGRFFKGLTEAKGRGGTDFRGPIESALRLKPKPDLLVYLTDGDGTTTDMPPPNLGVVWGIVPSHYNQAPAPWGHCVIISDDPNKRRAGVRRPKKGKP